MPRPFLTARWENLFLASYAVPPALLERRLPPGLALDLRDGQAFVSLVFNALLAGVIVVYLSDDARKLAAAATLLTLGGFVAWRVYRARAQRELAHELAAGPETAAEEAEPL